MRVAYVDTSVIVAFALNEREENALPHRLSEFDFLLSANLLEAELRSALAREGKPYLSSLVESLDWIFPARSLGYEFARVLDVGYLRGADLMHVATALYIAIKPSTMTFITLDVKQRSVAAKLGFRI